MTRATHGTCIAYASKQTKHTSSSDDYKYQWEHIPCDFKAPFICKHNPDFLGFHKLSNLVFGDSLLLDMRLPSMSLTTCLLFCQATAEPTHITYTLQDRCICAKGTYLSLLFFCSIISKFLIFSKALQSLKDQYSSSKINKVANT